MKLRNVQIALFADATLEDARDAANAWLAGRAEEELVSVETALNGDIFVITITYTTG